MAIAGLNDMDVLRATDAARGCRENARRAEPELAAAIGAAWRRGRQEAGGRPPGLAGRRSAMKGVKVAPKVPRAWRGDVGWPGRDTPLARWRCDLTQSKLNRSPMVDAVLIQKA